MIDNENLRTASLYINNQLVSRGLLRDGDSIDFAGTRRTDEEDAAVSGRIIGILNDLILRRDRDAEQRESLSISMRSLRAENIKLTADLARLNDKCAEAQRKADLAVAAESTLKTQLKSAEAHARALKEDVARMKSLVAQSRSSCATEIRRRDRQIDTLKKQLGEAGRSRGTRGNPAITTITVTGDVGSNERDMMGLMNNSRSVSSSNDNDNDNDNDISNKDNSVQYDSTLQRETNATLANLAQLLTEENESMLGVLQQTMAQLRDMSGWVADTREDEQVRKRPTCEDMAAELDSVMDHMRIILTNPSFVPIEEVVAREEEINRLKRGWVQMENRWKEAVQLMDGWRKRMALSGKPVCDEELQMGMRLSPVRVNGMDDGGAHSITDHGLSVVKEESEGENAHEYLVNSPCHAGNARGRLNYAAEEELEVESDHDAGADASDGANDSDIDAAHHEDEMPEDDDGATGGHNHETSNQPAQEGSSPEEGDEPLDSSNPLPERPQLDPLRNSTSAGNRGILKMEKPRLLSRPRPGPGRDCGTNGNESTRQSSGQSMKSMRSMPVRPRGPSSQFSRIPSKIHRPAAVERPRFPSTSSLDEALLSPRDPSGKGISSAAQPQDEESISDNVAAPAAAVSTIHATESDAQMSSATSSLASRSRSRSRSPPSCSSHRVDDSRTTGPPRRSTGLKAAQSPLTMSNIAAKLAASEKEADAARVRAKLKAVRGSTRGVSRPTMAPTAGNPETTESAAAAAAEAEALHEHEIPNAHELVPKPPAQTEDPPAQPEKRKRDRKASKAASRRRSTLSPWELQTLISGEAQ
ncbi:hypothetical protein E4U43_000841 [Claviceps pusilla]|uniref:NIMA interactive protein n=1 Tax=Claviceps pusilla TaxID=123648 RepID=A0A9P7SXC5_9HYPO|nr:hypothetical protein E4U43_000841 [Claviceps pusilla]